MELEEVVKMARKLRVRSSSSRNGELECLRNNERVGRGGGGKEKVRVKEGK